MDRLTKVAHFIPVRADYKGNKLEQLYIDNIFRLHGVPSRIISDRRTQFTAQFWKVYTKHWEHVWITVQPITHKPMDKQGG